MTLSSLCVHIHYHFWLRKTSVSAKTYQFRFCVLFDLETFLFLIFLCYLFFPFPCYLDRDILSIDRVFTYIYSLLIMDICDCWNISFKFPCVPFVQRSLHFFKEFLLSFPIFCIMHLSLFIYFNIELTPTKVHFFFIILELNLNLF